MHLLWSKHKVVYWLNVFFKSVDANALTLINYLQKLLNYLYFEILKWY